jgi:hypothetical protein
VPIRGGRSQRDSRREQRHTDDHRGRDGTKKKPRANAGLLSRGDL